MVLRLIDIEPESPGPLVGPESWIASFHTLYMRSHAFDVVKRNLRRYLQGEAEGHSLLIAGHRGAGKTTLMRRAVQELRDEGVRDGRLLRRPFLVKLHGPSLVAGEDPALSGADPPAAAADAKAGGGTINVAFYGGAPGAIAADPAPPAAEPPAASPQAALAHITVELYRALAREIALCFRLHALQAAGADRDPRLIELAASLKLELDGGPDPLTLRGFWRKLGRLNAGVVRPPGGEAGAPDAGMREIIALATAAQAYQVCTGAVTYSAEQKASGEATSQSSARAMLDAAPALNKLFGLLGGTALGVGLAAAGKPTAEAATAGVLAGLAGALSLGWSSSRARARSATTAYQFIRNSTLATLGRDLPHIIARVLEAGLAPVFIVDELDKVPALDGRAPADPPAPDPLAQLIDRLKYITTDYNFFAFLVNRTYYETFRQRMEAAAYPPEYTYFSSLQFVRVSAAEQIRYLLKAITPNPGAEAARVWLELMFAIRLRARGSALELRREMSIYFDQSNDLRPNFWQATQRPQIRVAACLQIAFDLVFLNPDVEDRIEQNPYLGQLLEDALYRIVDCWQRGDKTLDTSPHATLAYLIERATSARFITPEEQQFLAAQTRYAARMLMDVNGLADAAEKDLGFSLGRLGPLLDRLRLQSAIEQLRFIVSDTFPTKESGFFWSVPGQGHVFRYRFDRSGQPSTPDKKGKPEDTAAADMRARIRDLASLAKRFVAILYWHAVRISLLVGTGALPPGVPEEIDLGAMIARLDEVARSGDLSAPALAETVNDVSQLLDLIGGRFHHVTWLLSLSRWLHAVRANASSEASTNSRAPERNGLGVEEALLRFVWFEELPDASTSDPNSIRWAGLADQDIHASIPLVLNPGIKEFDNWPQVTEQVAQSFARFTPNRAAETPAEAISNWQPWLRRLVRFINDPGTQITRTTLATLADAVLGLGPGYYLQRDLAAVSLLQWSNLAIAVQQKPAAVPAWVAPVVAAILGFAPDVVRALAQRAGNDVTRKEKGTSLADQLEQEAFLRSGGDSDPVLFVVRDMSHPLIKSPPDRRHRGMLMVREADLHGRARPLLDIVEAHCNLVPVYVRS